MYSEGFVVLLVVLFLSVAGLLIDLGRLRIKVRRLEEKIRQLVEENEVLQSRVNSSAFDVTETNLRARIKFLESHIRTSEYEQNSIKAHTRKAIEILEGTL